MMLTPPFDPFVEEVQDERGNYLVLRSNIFNGLSSSKDVRNTSKELIKIINVVMSKTADADPISAGAVVEFRSGVPRKHIFVEVEASVVHVRGGFVELVLKDAQGNIIKPPPAPSKAQRWMNAVALEPNIGGALSYLAGKPGWVELYKAYEAIREMPSDGISKNEIKRFARTANAVGRHHPSDRNRPPSLPMELWEGRALITKWVSAAIEGVLARHQQ